MGTDHPEYGLDRARNETERAARLLYACTLTTDHPREEKASFADCVLSLTLSPLHVANVCTAKITPPYKLKLR